jgi:hypothetical protein
MKPHPLDSTASWQIADGMTVHGLDGEKLGTVRNYDPQVDYLDVRKGWLFHTDFYVPTTAVTAVDKDGVRLQLTRQDLDNDRYASPPATNAAMGGNKDLVSEPMHSGDQPVAVERDEVTAINTDPRATVH